MFSRQGNLTFPPSKDYNHGLKVTFRCRNENVASDSPMDRK